MDQREAIAGIFDRAAPTYDQVGVELFGPVAARLVEELAPLPGERVVDMGCGRGRVLLELAERVGPEGRAVGVDLAPSMVDAARTEAAQRGSSVDIRLGDIQAPDLEAGTFDIVASSLAVFFVPEPEVALMAWRQLLAAGGRVGVTTFGPFNEEWKGVEDALQSFLPEEMRDARKVGRSGPFSSDEGVEDLFVRTGLRRVRTLVETVSVRFVDADHWNRWSWSVGYRGLWEAVPESAREEAWVSVREALEAARLADGSLGFDQAVRFTLGWRE